jgi:hypothetical protein
MDNRRGLLAFLTTVLVLTATARGQMCNVKVVTDASPDYYDLDSLIYSATSRWSTPQEKCWALFYWNHIARRQTSPMHLHGLELTDPIRQFNDYGYTMCSTVAGINGSPFWDALKGEVKDEIELLTSRDGTTYSSQGRFNLDLRWKDLPVNLMWPDEETMTAPVFDLVPPQPVSARFVRYQIKARRFTQVSEVKVLDQVERKPFDLRIALPGTRRGTRQGYK